MLIIGKSLLVANVLRVGAGETTVVALRLL